MQTFTFIQYFFYLGINWNWRIALHIIRQEIKGERYYGIQTTGADELKTMKAAGIDISHATVYMPITYFQLHEIFAFLPAPNRYHFLDIGAGKGRAVCVAAHHGYHKVTGIDFSEAFCQAADKNLAITKAIYPQLQYNVISNDAAFESIPPDVDCIFLFNPFDHIVMQKVITNISSSLLNNPRQLHIAYANPLYKNQFLQTGFTEVYYSKRMNYLELSILKFRHP